MSVETPEPSAVHEPSEPAATSLTSPPASPPTSPPTMPSRGRRWLALLVAIVVLALVAGAVWTLLQVRDRRASSAADEAALDAGRQAAVAFTSYDHRHLDEDLGAVSDLATGKFREQFTAALGTLTQAIEKAKGVSVGRVTYAGLKERTDDEAVVLAAVDASITNRTNPKPSIRRYRLQITLTDESGDWLISDITPVA